MENKYDRTETIAAICTPPGEGGVAVVRICGPEALAVANGVFSRPLSAEDSHRVRYGRIASIDQGLAVPFLGGRSYTGDETVELHCHGGSLIARRVLESVLEAGARAAQPGEFTFRAFMNGKLDLAQAEAVQAVIHAKSDLAMGAASDQLEGRLSKRVAQFQRRLTEIAAILEAWVDFPEEGLEFATLDELLGQLAALVEEMEALLATFEQGRLLHDGVMIALVGSPNVGKSSLMNALLDAERAIVTHIAGTTRDTLEDHVRIGGLHARLVDTAGIRETSEIVEAEGIRRSLEAMERADLVIVLRDASNPNDLGPQVDVPHLVVWNKCDLVDAPSEGIAISAKHRQGLEGLIAAIEAQVWKGQAPARDQVAITNVRHKEALSEAIGACRRTAEGLAGEISPELLCVDLREGLHALGRIIGTDVSEDIINEIFSRFCLGK